jgi:hypothetical protein
MMKTFKAIAILSLLCFPAIAQVGINNTDPKATLDIEASNVATPTNTDGILIPRIDDFPLANPSVDQDGMLVFITGNSTPTKGFYFWDNSTTSWASVGGSTKSIVSATMSSGQFIGSSYVKVQFNTTSFDTNSEFDTANNRFVATNSGYYRINATARNGIPSSTTVVGMAIYVNGFPVKETVLFNTILASHPIIEGVISLNTTDYVEIFMSGIGTINPNTRWSYFEIQQLD